MIKKIKILAIILFVICNCVTGYFTYLYFTQNPEIKIIEKTKIAYKTVYRDYEKYTKTDCVKELKKYGTDIPKLDGHIEQPNIFYAEAGLYDRRWNRKFKLKIKQSRNWRYYLGFGAVGMAAGGFIIYKIIK